MATSRLRETRTTNVGWPVKLFTPLLPKQGQIQTVLEFRELRSRDDKHFTD